jgi:hypothetical protein
MPERAGRRGDATPIRSKELRAVESKCKGLREIRLTGFEPVTFGSVDRCSIQLSYRRKCLSLLDLRLYCLLPPADLYNRFYNRYHQEVAGAS